MLELNHWDRKRLHNLKYFTWVEQQGKTVEELDAQWDDPDYWTSKYRAWQDLKRCLACLYSFVLARSPS